MFAEKSSTGKPARKSSRNADYRWAEFDSEAYFQHYYGEPHPDDDHVIRLAVAAVKSAPPLGAELDVVDVGTGPNLFPLFCTLPRARRAHRLGIRREQCRLARSRARAGGGKMAVAPFLGCGARRLCARLSPARGSHSSAAREMHGHPRLGLRAAKEDLGRGDHVLLRRVDHREPR